jgi:hypothetical protein
MRRTIAVHTRLAGHMAQVEAARAGAHGIQILTMGKMAARLAGGFLVNRRRGQAVAGIGSRRPTTLTR